MTAYFVRRAAGLLHPATDQGFVAFRFRLAPTPSPPKKREHGTPRRRSPQRGSHPPKSFPRRQPYRVTAAVALLPLRRHLRPLPAEASAGDSLPTTEAARVLRPTRTPKSTTRADNDDEMNDPMKLRSAEADPHVTAARQPSEHAEAAQTIVHTTHVRRQRRSTAPTWAADLPSGWLAAEDPTRYPKRT
jgi:hypothetical protein